MPDTFFALIMAVLIGLAVVALASTVGPHNAAIEACKSIGAELRNFNRYVCLTPDGRVLDVPVRR